MPAHGALGKDKGTAARVGVEGSANHLFRVAEAVDGGCIDPVDSQIEGAMDGGDGFVVVLGAPGVFPVATADGPGAKANRRELKVRVAKGAQGSGRRLGHNKRIDAEGPAVDSRIPPDGIRQSHDLRFVERAPMPR